MKHHTTDPFGGPQSFGFGQVAEARAAADDWATARNLRELPANLPMLSRPALLKLIRAQYEEIKRLRAGG